MEQNSIGFIGLGMMGDPMSRCLAKAGHTLRLLDTDAARTEALCRDLGAMTLTRENAAGLDLLITMLPNSAIVETVLLDAGWADALLAGATVIDMSSSEPVRSRALGETLAGRGSAISTHRSRAA